MKFGPPSQSRTSSDREWVSSHGFTMDGQEWIVIKPLYMGNSSLNSYVTPHGASRIDRGAHVKWNDKLPEDINNACLIWYKLKFDIPVWEYLDKMFNGRVAESGL